PPRIVHGGLDGLLWICRLPPILLLQTTFAPALMASAASATLLASTFPPTVTPVSRTPLACWSWTLPLTVTITRSHQLPFGTVRLPSTVVALSCLSSQVMFLFAAFSVAVSGRLAGTSASPTHTLRPAASSTHCCAASDQYESARASTCSVTSVDAPGASSTRSNCASDRTANWMPLRDPASARGPTGARP